MPRSSRAIAILCALAVAMSSSLLPSTPADERHRSHVASKHKAAKHGRHKSARDKSDKDDTAKNENAALETRTPVDKHDCIDVSQTFYRRGGGAGAGAHKTTAR